MSLDFEWDPVKAALNVAKHRGVYAERRRRDHGAEVIRIISAREATRGERTGYEEGTR